jgi:Family of unknown function (DUF6790)
VPKTKIRVIEIILLYVLVVMVGFGGLWAFIGHAFLPNQIAAYIGWPAGSPFQFEVAVTNLAFGVLGILCFWIRDNFWTATVIGYSIFSLGDAYVHINDFIQHGNYAPGNIGAPLFIDIILPVILIIFLFTYKKNQKKSIS